MGITYWIFFDDMLHASAQEKRGVINMTKVSNKNKQFMVLYYDPSTFISKNRKYAMSCNFKNCQWNNCDITFDKKYANKSDVLIFNGIFMPKRLNFIRPHRQVWIFTAQESPLKYHTGGNWWKWNKSYQFNWTMTYNKDNTDIFLPYGEIRKHSMGVKRDFESIALRKNKTLLMIASNCKPDSKRQEYIKQLQKYIDVDILGKCGKKWECGHQYRHDDNCFQILNKYKFYLAFENAFCHQYFSEKIFENYNYDTIMITRGGSNGDAKRLFPKGTYLSTDDFKSIKDLALYLKNLTLRDYVQLLERKSQFYSVGYKEVYQRALCDICKKLNFPKIYGKTISDMNEWAFHSKPCLESSEVQDLN